MSTVYPTTGDHYVAIPDHTTKPVVKESQPADTSKSSIRAVFATFAGAFTTAAGVAMLNSTNATVVSAGIAFTTVGAVATAAGATFFLYKWYKS